MLFTFTPHVMRGACNWLLFTSFTLLGITAQAALHDTSPPQLKTAEQWSATSPMNIARDRFSATMLFNGKVLVVGGSSRGSNDVVLNSVELYDPSTGIWHITSHFPTKIFFHTATLLTNGNVLVAGGDNEGTLATSAAYLYNPLTEQWTQTGSLNTGRWGHAAVLLANGKVLVVGGSPGGHYFLNTLELYNPVTGQWSLTGYMSAARYLPAVTRLTNDKVLITGGKNNNSYMNSSEIYDPTTGTCSLTGYMNTAREWHSATLLFNGKVLVMGGYNQQIASTELYDPATGQWTATGSFITTREMPTATLLANGNVIAAGGDVASTELYNYRTGTWSSTGSMSTARKYHTATLLPSGKVLVAGGWNGSSLSSAELYEPAAPTLTAPAVSTDAPSLITATSAILKGTVNPNGAATTVTFNFGPTTAYGTNIVATPATIAATAVATNVSTTKTGLTCGSTYHYRVTAVNSVGTTNGGNQVFTTNACQRDLVITNITLNPAKPVAGTAFSAVITVKNQGSSATAASKLKLWPNLATVPVCTIAAPKIADIAAIPAGASININVSGLISNLVGGNTFRTFIDGTCIIGETNEANNHRILKYRIGGRLPDLIITNIALTPATLAKNTLFNAAITVKNQGTAVSSSSFVDVWANQATAVTCDILGNAWADVNGLAAGASTVVNVTGLNAGATAGTKTLRAFVDSWCEETEANETNNQMIKSYTVQ